jgi:N-acetylglucosamine kinase-like BadF-type ATPase
LVENSKIIQRIFTKGINPFYQTDSEIRFEIEQNLAPQIQNLLIDNIYFYGAGCSFPEKKAMVINALGHVFANTLIEVQSDLLGAARGLLLNNEGVACILGTGSNSCHYNGNEIVSNVSPLGYMLGDEGSGAVLSKIFVADCLKNQVSEKTKNAFFEKYELTPATIMENVYKKPFPNRYLAQFTPFLSENINQKEIYNVVYKSFVDFFERNVQQYPYQELETSFVGSVAFHLKEVLESAAEQCGVKIGKIMKSPMEGLIKYHDVAM